MSLRDTQPDQSVLARSASAQSDGFCVGCGADSFVIRDGKIRMQTIHDELLQS
jgi:hypothetical protein